MNRAEEIIKIHDDLQKGIEELEVLAPLMENVKQQLSEVGQDDELIISESELIDYDDEVDADDTYINSNGKHSFGDDADADGDESNTEQEKREYNSHSEYDDDAVKDDVNEGISKINPSEVQKDIAVFDDGPDDPFILGAKVDKGYAILCNNFTIYYGFDQGHMM